MVLLAACGGPGRQAAPTALPPGERIEQPTPVFVGATTPGARPTPETTPEVATAETSVDSVQALLATQIALRAVDAQVIQEISVTEGVEIADATPTPPVTVNSASRAMAESALNRPTSLGIVGGAGTGFFGSPGGAVLRDLPAGATVTITGRSGDGGWYAAYLDSGLAGWVGSSSVQIFGDRSELLVVSSSASPAIVATMIAEASRPLGPIATPDSAPIARAAMPTATPSIATVSPGGGESLATLASPATEERRPQAVVIVDGLNVRTGPGTDFAIVGGLVRDTRMNLLARNEAGDWLQIESPEGSGWVFAQLVESEEPSAELPIAGGQ
jgi:hypothetical protein